MIEYKNAYNDPEFATLLKIAKLTLKLHGKIHVKNKCVESPAAGKVKKTIVKRSRRATHKVTYVRTEEDSAFTHSHTPTASVILQYFLKIK